MKPAIRASIIIAVLTALVSCASSSDALRNFFSASRAYCVHAPAVEALVIPVPTDASVLAD